jgi:RimJ/RimL family protein N-acetyltransferase
MIPRKLASFEGKKLINHLCNLKGEDRRLRFGALVSDESIDSYVKKTLINDDTWFVFGKHEIVAACHVSIYKEEAELGCSVNMEFRKQKFAQALFNRAIIYLRANNIKNVYMHCLSENEAMRHIAKKNDMTVVRCSEESNALVQIDPPSPLTLYHNEYLNNIAIYDMLIRTQSEVYGTWLETFKYGKKQNSIE